MFKIQNLHVEQIINSVLEEQPHLRLSIGLQLIDMGFYCIIKTCGEEFLKDYITTYLHQNASSEYSEH